ncbi:glycosyl transferase [Methylobacterium sp. Leaf399]|uniref:glycosyltransferase n=1 Tax=Methylobacterium sp. Leaf399 TaxID=1736364 RepID=UPI000700394B|nr:glycosyltransferase [Methylobacterium sp. Leaf399]KQT19753.1 glycosyl transferase [Methylobacterium sp. Leaf399]
MSSSPEPSLPAARIEAVIAIPVRNEAERIGACLRAIDAQAGLAPGSLGLVLFLNNCTDATPAIVAGMLAGMSLPVRVVEVTFSGANAGWARREAMNAAADWLEAEGEGGTILSTDADSRVPPDWVERNLAAMAAGADAVAGRVELDADEAALLPPSLPARGRLEDAYSDLLTEAEALIDPDPNDPWPCHRTTIGATLAVSVSAYRQVGGMPPMALGEDGAFVAALLQHGLRVRHAVDVVVTISARLTGRAPGGVADTIRSRCELPDALCDARLEPLPSALFRYGWRRRLRRLHAGGRLARNTAWARLLGIPPEEARRIAEIPLAGLALAQAERASPRLAYHPLGPKELPGQIAVAEAALVTVRDAAARRRGKTAWG